MAILIVEKVCWLKNDFFLLLQQWYWEAETRITQPHHPGLYSLLSYDRGKRVSTLSDYPRNLDLDGTDARTGRLGR
jgi:hypothetical protein